MTKHIVLRPMCKIKIIMPKSIIIMQTQYHKSWNLCCIKLMQVYFKLMPGKLLFLFWKCLCAKAVPFIEGTFQSSPKPHPRVLKPCVYGSIVLATIIQVSLPPALHTSTKANRKLMWMLNIPCFWEKYWSSSRRTSRTCSYAPVNAKGSCSRRTGNVKKAKDKVCTYIDIL